MQDDFALSDVFSAKRFVNGVHKSTIYWSVCQNLPADRCQRKDNPCCSSPCCESFVEGLNISCGSLASASLVLDRFLQYTQNNISFVAGVSLRYTGGDKVSDYLPEITSKDPKPLCFELDLKCDPLTSYFQLPTVDAFVSDAGTPCLRARVESQHGCVTNGFKALHLTSWKILFFIIAPAAMLSGLLLTFCGWRLFRITSLVLGLFFGLLVSGIAILFSVFLACEATKPRVIPDFWNWSHECTFHYLTANPYIGWIASSVGLLFGLLLAVLAYWRPTFGGALIGMATGAWLSDYVYVTTFSVLKQHWIILLIAAIFIPLGAALGALLPSSWKRPYFIITISITGAYLFCWGVGAYARFFPTSSLLDDIVGPRWEYYVYTAAILVLGITGTFVQWHVTGAFDWDTLMDSGLCPTKRRRGGTGVAKESLLAKRPEEDIEMVGPVKKLVSEISDVE